jgi:hypothetical protein
MFVDVEGGAVNVKIAVVSAEPGAAASLVRAVAARTARSCTGELVEPNGGDGRLVGFDFYVPAMKLESGELAHPHLYALDARPGALVTDVDWATLFQGADAVLRVGATFASLELALRFAPSVPVHGASDDGLDGVITTILEGALSDARAGSSEERGGDAVGFASLTCPWCLEPVEITIEADLEGTFVQDCEVCCRPWTVNVGRDEDGDLRVDVDRA